MLSEVDAYIRGSTGIEEDWNTLSSGQKEDVLSSLPEHQQETIREALHRIVSRWDTEYHSGLKALQTARRNQIRRQQRLAMGLSAISPLGGINAFSMDLARTGFIQRERLEDTLNSYLVSLSQLIQKKLRKNLFNFGGVDLSDFTWFDYRDTESLGTCLARNALHILNLVLLAVLGFAGAYVAILRYDVR